MGTTKSNSEIDMDELENMADSSDDESSKPQQKSNKNKLPFIFSYN
jgi:hypothetical protein